MRQGIVKDGSNGQKEGILAAVPLIDKEVLREFKRK